MLGIGIGGNLEGRATDSFVSLLLFSSSGNTYKVSERFEFIDLDKFPAHDTPFVNRCSYRGAPVVFRGPELATVLARPLSARPFPSLKKL